MAKPRRGADLTSAPPLPPPASLLPTLLHALIAAVGLTAISGMALAAGYDADPATAHATTQAATQGAGAVLRGVHLAAASASLVVAILAGVATFVRPACSGRAILWGAALVALLLGAFESGVILPWDHRAWEAWVHVATAAGFFGMRWAREDPSSVPLALVAGFHFLVIPLAAAGLFLGARREGISMPTWQVRPVAVTAAIIIGIGLLVRPALGPAPVAGLTVSRPHWPFLWLSPLQETFGSIALLTLPIALVAATGIAWGLRRWTPKARGFTAGALLLVWAVLTWLGAT